MDVNSFFNGKQVTKTAVGVEREAAVDGDAAGVQRTDAAKRLPLLFFEQQHNHIFLILPPNVIEISGAWSMVIDN